MNINHLFPFDGNAVYHLVTDSFYHLRTVLLIWINILKHGEKTENVVRQLRLGFLFNFSQQAGSAVY